MGDRRAFLFAFAGMVATGPAVVAAQSPGPQKRRIGLLGLKPMGPEQNENIRAGLRERGWIEGRNLIVESRYADDDPTRLRALADELVRMNVEIIVGSGTLASLAAKQATATIPIVIYGSGDPLRTGLVSNLARPGGNVTGTTTLSNDLDAKRLQLLREIMPGVTRVGELVNPANPVFHVGRETLEEAYRSLGVAPIFVDVAAGSEIESAVSEVARRGAQALVVGSDWSRVVRAARRFALPMMVESDFPPDDGWLIAYFPEWAELDRQVGAFVDKILRGAKPGELPIEQPRLFRLLINLRTARTYGISVPPSLLVRADKVIQ